MRSPRGVLFWERSIECVDHFTHNTDKCLVEVVPVLTIFTKDLHMRLKRKSLGPIADPRGEEGKWP